MNIKTRKTSPIALAVALVLGGGVIPPVQADFSDWKCAKCEFPGGARGSVELGAITVSDTSARFGDFTGLDEDGSYTLFDVDLNWWGKDGMWFNLAGGELGLDSRSLDMQGGLRGLFEVGLYFQSTPRRFHAEALTPYSLSGTNTLVLPADWVPGGDTGSMNSLEAALAPAGLGYDRDNSGVSFSLVPMQYWSLDADYRQEERDGSARQWANFVNNSAELAQPVSSTTEEYTLGVNYARGKSYLRAEYYGSTYDSDFNGIRWQNAYSGPGPEFGQKAVAPDNEFHQGSVAASYRFDAWRTQVSTRVAAGTMKQQAPFLPATINDDFAFITLAGAHLDGRVDTSNTNFKVVTNPGRDLRLTAEFRSDERDNKTPVNFYQGVLGDAWLNPTTRANTPYSFKREDLRLKGVFRVSGLGSFQAGYDQKRFERDLQERAETETDKLWATLQFRPGHSVDGFLTVSTEERDGSDYQYLASDSPQNPLMRKYNMADRTRDSLRLQLGFEPMDRVSVGVSGDYSQDKYENSTLGLTGSEYSNLTVDATVLLPAESTLYLMYSNENIRSTQVGSQGLTFGDPNWTARVKDVFDTALVGITVPAIKDRLDVKLDYTYTDSSSRTSMQTNLSSSAYPERTTGMDMVKLYLDYRYSHRLSLHGGYWYETYDSDDWALAGVGPDTVYNVLALGSQPQVYDQGVFWVSFRYAFGMPEPEAEE